MTVQKWSLKISAPLFLLVLFGCGSSVQQGVVEVLDTFPHDSTAFTQGLALADGELFESTGRYGYSTIRRVEPETGQVLQMEVLDSAYFGEGLAVVGQTLIQLTWKEHVAFVYDAETFGVVDTLSLPTFGWGLCASGDVAYLTGGGSALYKRALPSWDDLGFTQMERDGELLRDVNELECVGPHAYANIFQSNTIVKIDLETGKVVTRSRGDSPVPVAH